MAVEKLDAVQSVDTDMNKHTVTVKFDDQKLSIEQLILALNNAGYTVPSYSQLE